MEFFKNTSVVAWIAVNMFFQGCVTTEDSWIGDSSTVSIKGVLLDPGHGGEPEEAAKKMGESFKSISKLAKQGYREECYGAISASGYKEKTATLEVAKKVKSLLEEAGIATDFTRPGDAYLTLDERVEKICSSKYQDWLLVSIHFNRSSKKQEATDLKAKYRAPQGFEIYIMRSSKSYPSGTDPLRHSSRLLAKSIESRLDSISGLHNRGIKDASFMVLRESTVPSVLIEGGFLSNPDESELIATEDYQWTLSRAIAAGIQDYKTQTARAANKGVARSGK